MRSAVTLCLALLSSACASERPAQRLDVAAIRTVFTGNTITGPGFRIFFGADRTTFVPTLSYGRWLPMSSIFADDQRRAIYERALALNPGAGVATVDDTLCVAGLEECFEVYETIPGELYRLHHLGAPDIHLPDYTVRLWPGDRTERDS
jgi:hypothetical protein